MRKALVLASLASLALLSISCASTDYSGTGPGGSLPIGVNKSHGVPDCKTDDRVGNTQQTLENAALIDSAVFGIGFGGSCISGFNPAPASTSPDAQEKRDWLRFNGPWAFQIGVQIRFTPPNPFDGHWEAAGVKDLADGSRRVNTYKANLPPVALFNPFTCPTNQVFRNGGGENMTTADAMVNNLGEPPRIPGIHVETLCIDSSAAVNFCPNIMAASPEAMTRGYSTYFSFGRGFEGRLTQNPLTRHAGLAEFLGGAPMDVTVQGVTFRASGDLKNDGTVDLSLLGASHAGEVYTAGETPILVNVDPTNNRQFKIQLDRTEAARLGEWAIAAGLTDVTHDLTGVQVPEFGVTLPELSLIVSSGTIRDFINNAVPGGSDGL